MNDKMAMFLFEMAQKGAKSKWRDIPSEFMILNPYQQWPKPVRKPAFMDRPFGPGYQTHPELSRPALPILVGSVMKSPLFLAVAIPASIAITLQYISGDEPNYPWSPRINQQPNDPSSLYMN